MKSRMQPRHYLSQEVFARERERIFRKLWVFAGLRTMLRQNNDFITRQIAGIPVVIQNFRGELKAFENVCLHRSARLQSEPEGRRPLVCAYHGWSYDAQGFVNHIPVHDELYRFPSEERAGLRLREFALRALGNLLFINLAPAPMPIEAQFDASFIELLESCSNAYDGEVMMTTWHARFNWKLAYENLRDPNHPGFVHSQTLARSVSFVPTVDEAMNAAALPDIDPGLDTSERRAILRTFSYGGPEGEFIKQVQLPWWEKVHRWGEVDAYFNWLAYPNLHIACVDGGRSFTIEHHVPVAPDRTDIELYWMTAAKREAFPWSSKVLLSLMHGAKLVLDEDVKIMEQVQAALHAGAPVARQGDYEGLNKRVERWYVDIIDGNREV